MKTFILSVLLASPMAFAGNAESIKSDLENPHLGLAIEAKELIGGYEGDCYQGRDFTSYRKEALYVGVFKNATGEKSVIPLATEHLYNSGQPAFLKKYLNTGISKNWTRIGQVTRMGWSGSDNNVGKLTTGPDFSYLYTAKVTGHLLSLEVGQQSLCQPGQFCNPPLLPACETGRTADGEFVFQGCVMDDDLTIFKRISATELVSKRTSRGWDLGPNLLTPDLGVDSFCRWTLKVPAAQVPAQFRE